ncbi:MAG TPA: DUF6531 domain-containing protein, partial [Candidatus Aminicenantes bacterium]|nr:DUF6531 domain-containing protein [Candidatus Aminicenantes bacterium]
VEGSFQTLSREHLSGLDLALGYTYDQDGDGRTGEAEDTDEDTTTSEDEKRDLVFFSLQNRQELCVLDMTGRKGEFGKIGSVVFKNSGGLSEISFSAKSRKLYLTDSSAGLYVVDLSHPQGFAIDKDQDGIDDRIVGTVLTKGDARYGLVVDEKLNLAYVGDLARGVESLRLGDPKVMIVADADQNGIFEEVQTLVPEGLTAGSSLPSKFYVLSYLPPAAGEEVTAIVEAVNSSGEPLVPWKGENLAKSRLPEVKLIRQNPSESTDERFNLYLSAPITLTVKANGSASSLLSGDEVKASLSPELSTLLSYLKREEFSAFFDKKPAFRVELMDSDTPEPVNNPSTGMGEASYTGPGLMDTPSQGGVYLHSGEFYLEETDLSLPGRGFDLLFTRTYESQSLYSGPLGWGWEHSYNRRLQFLPSGDILRFDGKGRRETYKGVEGKFQSPTGRFDELNRRLDGTYTLLLPDRSFEAYDALGRLAA